MELLRVLVVDDEPGMRRGVARTLRDFTVATPNVEKAVRFDVDEADSGEAALEHIERQTPDILLIDYKMPGISGLEVLERLARQNSDILVIMITAYASIETAVAATKQGAYDFLTKPFTPEELRGTIRKATMRISLAREARKLAEERRQVRFQFIRVLGHELKSPLGAVDSLLQMVQNRSLGNDLDTYQEALDRSRERIRGMFKLIDDLLDMTRIESGQKDRLLEQIDLAAIARSAADLHRSEAVRRGIDIRVPLPVPIFVTADRAEMEMIFNNLVSNAVKYNCDQGNVEIGIDREAGRVRIRVSDTGIGLSEEEAERLFEEFVRIRNARTRGIQGSGLGLSIVKKIVSMYGGEVSVASRPGKGSQFTVVLPEENAADESTAASEVGSSASGGMIG